MGIWMSDENYYLTEKGNIIQAVHDHDAISPREFDNIGKLFLMDRSPLGNNETDFDGWTDLLDHYNISQSGYGTKSLNTDVEHLIEAAKECGDILLPVSTYEHGGITVYIGMPGDHFDGQWDCSFQGFIIADNAVIEREYGSDSNAAEKAAAEMEEEIKLLSEWVNGEVFGYIEYDGKSGEEVGSCFGFYGDDPNTNGISDDTGKIIEELGFYTCIDECMEDNADKLGIFVSPLPSLKERISFAEQGSVEQTQDYSTDRIAVAR